MARAAGVLGALVGLLLVAGYVLLLVAGRGYRVPSSSMEPTLHCARPDAGCEAGHRDRILAFRFVHWGRGDIVAFRLTGTEAADCGSAGGTFVKRVIGLPGDRVAERNGVFSVDGKTLVEPYLAPGRRDHQPGRAWRVPPGRVFLVGDNRSLSCDSRTYGPVRRSEVIGKVVLRYWPPSRIGLL